MKTVIKSAVATILLAVTAFAGDLVNTSGASKAAVNGFDTVAFFTDSKAVNGSPFITAEHGGAVYYFANEEHKSLFLADPSKYTPQYGGYCAFGVAIDKLLPVDISTWQVRDGKLYLNLNPEILKGFNAEFTENVAKAESNWPGLVKANGK